MQTLSNELYHYRSQVAMIWENQLKFSMIWEKYWIFNINWFPQILLNIKQILWVSKKYISSFTKPLQMPKMHCGSKEVDISLRIN